MADRRSWSQNEKDKLIELVQQNYDFLTSSLTPAKTKAMVDKKWREITDEINSIGDGSPLSVLQVKRKWADEKSKTKKVVSKYRKEMGKTGGGTNTADAPSAYQAKIASFIGNTVVDGIPGAASLDTSAHRPPLPSHNPLEVVTYHGSNTMAVNEEMSSIANDPPATCELPSSTPNKRQKLSAREKQS